jgi:hypothetical protein
MSVSAELNSVLRGIRSANTPAHISWARVERDAAAVAANARLPMRAIPPPRSALANPNLKQRTLQRAAARRPAVMKAISFA